MSNIHPTAVIEDGAQIAASAKIGPFCVIGSKAKIGENVQLIAHVTIMNDTTIGDGTSSFRARSWAAVRRITATNFSRKRNSSLAKTTLSAKTSPCSAARRKNTLPPPSATTACSWSIATLRMTASSATTSS